MANLGSAVLSDPPSTLLDGSPMSVQNTSAWYNFTTWAANVTRYAPSLEDIVWAGPRIFMKIGSYVALTDPLVASERPYMSAAADIDLPDRIADSSIFSIMDSVPRTTGATDPGTNTSRLTADGARGLGSVFSYATSKWAVSCIAMAVVLNRTHIFAATRRRLRFRWPARLALRISPIILLAFQARILLQSIQCQTSPEFAQLRWGDETKSSDLMFSHANRLLNTLCSILLVGATDEQSCVAVRMIPSQSDVVPDLQGSLSRLWPLFGTFCLSQFIETVSCAVQGRPLASETSMTLFEHSLAFAEADGAVSNQLGWSNFSKSRRSDASPSTLGGSIAVTRSMILRRVNTPPEVLLVALLSTMTHITNHLLGLFDLQAKYRLVNTATWGLCFMGSLAWNAYMFDLDDPASQGLLRFPTVCIIGFVPHVLVLAGILLCLLIYGVALLLTTMAPPSDTDISSMSFRERLRNAHQNMQANVSLSEIRLTREMDFYTALLRAGFASITMASEAVYLNEDRNVSLKQHTWLEEARYREAEQLQRQWLESGLSSSKYDPIGAIGLVPVKDGAAVASNGYERERAAQKVRDGRSERRGFRIGIGATERSSRWLLAVEYVLSISKLLARVGALAVLGFLSLLRIRYRPAWLRRLAHQPKIQVDEEGAAKSAKQTPPSVLNDNNRIPRTEGIDVEAEFRRVDATQDEESLDVDLYKYWLKGGWWGSSDSSGDFTPGPMEDEWDNTSFISLSTRAGNDTDESIWESDDEGQKTPTQHTPCVSREGTPFVDSPLHISDFARLLHPTNKEDREEAETLSAHLQSNRVLTRSGFHRMEQLKRARILMSPRRSSQSQGFGGKLQLNPEDEERLLEEILLSRRQASSGRAEDTNPWDRAGAGNGGPHCVVCQSSPRTIIVWPCRCLSLCNECRVSLAMNNFDKCVCCRRQVMSFSRIFVP